MTNAEAVALIGKMSACPSAIQWVRDCGLSGAKLWRTCKRGDWLLWLAVMVEVDRKLIVLAACACVRTSLGNVPKDELRPLRAIEAAEGWTRGKVNLASVRNAAAYAAAAAAAAAADAHQSIIARLVRKHIPYSRIVKAVSVLRRKGIL